MPQLVVDLLEQFFRLFGMALHVPFVGFLRGGDLLVGLPTQILGLVEIGMVSLGDILGRIFERSRYLR